MAYGQTMLDPRESQGFPGAPDWRTAFGRMGGMGGFGGFGGGGQQQPMRPPGGQAGWGERAPGQAYTWQDLSYPADPQFLGGYIRDYANKMGYFGDPRQSALFDFSRQQAGQASKAFQRRSMLGAQMAGLPQGQQGYAWLQGMLGGQGAEASTMNQLLRQQFEQQQDYARQLAQQFAQIPDTRQQTKAMEQSWMGPLGQIGGAALGSIFGPAGMAIGGALGGMGGGGGGPQSYMGQPGWQYPYQGGRR